MSAPKLVNLFFSHIQSCRMVFPDGSEAAFMGGRYATDDADKIYYLNSEIAKGHPHIYVKSGEEQIDPAELDPVESQRRKIIAEYLAQQEALKLTSSTSEQSALKPSSTADLVDTKTPEELLLAQGVEVQPAPEVVEEKLVSGVSGVSGIKLQSK